MRIRTVQLLAVSLLIWASLAQAATYQWLDDLGVAHFTDDADSIPARYLGRAKEITAANDAGEIAAASPGAPIAAGQPAPAQAHPAAAGVDALGPKQQALERLGRELKESREALQEKKRELARLYRRWLVVKGRNPSKEEIEKFEKKRAKGEATYKDNPYINKNPLSTPAPARMAYYKKLEEVGKDEARLRQLERELETLETGR